MSRDDFRGVAPGRPGRTGAAAVLTLFLAGTAFAAGPPPLDLQLAQEPAVVTTTARREFTGLLDGFRDGRLFIRRATGGGEVEYSFAPDEIAALQLPGSALAADATELCERGAWAEALPLLEALGRQRLRYLPLLNPDQRAPLRLLVAASTRVGDPLTTLGYVNELLPGATAADERSDLLDAQLRAHARLGHTAEVRRLAAAWCARADPHGGSALGWSMLARLAYDAGDFEPARWIALQPVVFSGFLPTEQLDVCYALAIAAAHRLGDTAHAAVLFQEMRERGLAWPSDPSLAAIGQFYADGADPSPPASPSAAFAPPAAGAPVNPPPPDEPQPLGSVRKLVAPPAAP